MAGPLAGRGGAAAGGSPLARAAGARQLRGRGRGAGRAGAKGKGGKSVGELLGASYGEGKTAGLKDQRTAKERGEPGFKWNPSYNRWERDDENGLPMSEIDYKVQPESGEAYTLWPIIHTALKDYGLESLPPAQCLKLQASGKAVIVDVRMADQFAKQHIAGAVNVPLFRPVQGSTMFDTVKKLAMGALAMTATERNPDFAAEARAVIPPGKRVIVACMVGGTLETVVTVKKGAGKQKTAKVSPGGGEAGSTGALSD